MKKIIIILFSIALVSCTASVPKEVVELSYQMEKDLVQVKSTYISLVRQHVTLLKRQREYYLQHEWIPNLIEDWIAEGELISLANGTKIYDDELGDFKSVSSPQRAKQLNSIVQWASVAVEEIDAKRKELLQPLDDAEKQLIEDIERSFSLLLLGNQTITAHLNSIREVQNVQNQLLEKAEWGGLRNDINSKLSNLSDQAMSGLNEIRKFDNQSKKTLEKLK